MTPDEIKAFITSRLFPKKRAALLPADFTDAWQALEQAKREALVNAAIAGKIEDTGGHVASMLNDYARALAETRADEIVANGSMDLSEFTEVFG